MGFFDLLGAAKNKLKETNNEAYEWKSRLQGKVLKS